MEITSRLFNCYTIKIKNEAQPLQKRVRLEFVTDQVINKLVNEMKNVFNKIILLPFDLKGA